MFLVRFPSRFRHVFAVLSLDIGLKGERTAATCSAACLTDSTAMGRLHPRSSAESIGRWYWRYVGVAEQGRVQATFCRFVQSIVESDLGYDRAAKFSSPGGEIPDKPHVYVCPSTLKLNHWALSGDWAAKKQLALLNSPNGRITYRFHARDFHLIIGPSAPGAAARSRVTIDGQLPGAAHGFNVDAEGKGTIAQQRLYQSLLVEST